MAKTAIILGATGLTGSFLLQFLLKDARYTKIKVFTRSPLNLQHEKLEEFRCNLLELEKSAEQFTADEVYCCIGTTAKNTPDKQLYRKIDHGIPVNAAILAKKNKIPTCIVVSAIGANAASSIFYNKTKGEMEQEVLDQKIKQTYILRPSIIQGKRNETRLGEKIGLIVMALFRFILIGPWKKYRVIKAESIAKAMVIVANQGFDQQIISSDQIEALSKQ